MNGKYLVSNLDTGNAGITGNMRPLTENCKEFDVAACACFLDYTESVCLRKLAGIMGHRPTTRNGNTSAHTARLIKQLYECETMSARINNTVSDKFITRNEVH